MLGGNQRMQMYGKCLRIFLIIVCCLGWCPPITPVSIPKSPDLSIHVGCMAWGGPLATTPTPVVAPEPEPVQAAPTPPPPPPAPQVEAVFSGRSGIGRREFVDIKFIGSFSPRISRHRLMWIKKRSGLWGKWTKRRRFSWNYRFFLGTRAPYSRLLQYPSRKGMEPSIL